jgi:glycosyltransferase involved in cell wall biosynthesis
LRIAILAPLVTAIVSEQQGGSQALVAELALALADRGHNVTVFAASGSSIPGVDVVDTQVDPAALHDVLSRMDGTSRVSEALRSAFRAAYGAIGEDFDVIHNHGFDPPAISEGARARAPVVHTLHLLPTTEMVAALASTRSRQPGCLVVCVSRAQERLWAPQVRIDRVVRNGVPVDRIPWSSSSGDVALFAGRLSPEKGPHLAMDLADQAGLPIIVAGPTYDEVYVREELRARFERPGVVLAGPLARHELWATMARASVLLVPSLWDEPFGLVAAEAQATGTPVLATRRGALPEIIDEGRSGLFMDAHDLAGGGRALAATRSLDRSVIRRWAESTLDIREPVVAYEELYELAVDRAQGGAKL